MSVAWEPSEAELEEVRRFSGSKDGCVTSGWRCPVCEDPNARVVELLPPYGARVECHRCCDVHDIEF